MGVWREARITGGFSLIRRDADGNGPGPPPGSCRQHKHSCFGHSRTRIWGSTVSPTQQPISTGSAAWINDDSFLPLHHVSVCVSVCLCEATALRQRCRDAVYVCCRVHRLLIQLTHKKAPKHSLVFKEQWCLLEVCWLPAANSANLSLTMSPLVFHQQII